MPEKSEKRKPIPPPPEPKVMPSALVAHMQKVPTEELSRPEPRVMPAAIDKIEKAKKPEKP